MFWVKFKYFVIRKFAQLIQKLRIHYYQLLSDCVTEGRPVKYQPVQCVGRGYIKFNGIVRFGVFPSPFYYNGYCYIEARNKNAKITFGNGTWINNNFVAISEHKSITIGEKVVIGTLVEIYDSNFHGIEPDRREISSPVEASGVVIEDNVFIGSNVKILKGVTVGQDSIIANGSIVTKSIPAGVIAGGNPAQVIKSLYRKN